MRISHKAITFGVAAIAGLLAVSPASATVQTITQTIPMSLQLTDWINRSFSFNLFNSNLGTLTKVFFTSEFGATSALVITNGGGSVSSGSAFMTSVLTLSTGSSNINTALGTTLSNSITGASSTYSLAIKGHTTAESDAEANDKVKSLTTNPSLSYFEAAGPSTMTMLANTVTQTFVGNTGGNTSASQVTNAFGFFSVEYTYDDSTATPPGTPVPEPFSIAILGIGMLGLAGAVRRKFRA
jgi:hypothetical protein